MPNDSPSPLNALQNLLDWQALPLTQEALRHLQERLRQTELLVHADVRSDFFRNLDGVQCQQARDQAIGETRGLKELSRYIETLSLGYKETLTEQQNPNNN